MNEREDPNDFGSCRRHAPYPQQYKESDISEHHLEEVEWPITDDFDWCGEFEAKSSSTQRKLITKQQANVRVMELLIQQPNKRWTCRELASLVPCSVGLIPSLSTWRSYHKGLKK